MRAIQFSQYGDPEVLTLVTTAEEPAAGPGQVRIRVRATAVNPFDHKVRSGMLARGEALAAPMILGLEAAGVVDQLGDGVSGVAIGDEVFGLGSATYAEFAVLRAWAPKPAGFSFEQAAALGVAGETSIRALGLLSLQPGQTVLIHGAAGAVGQAAVQVARTNRLHVIGTASEVNHDLLRTLGAEPVTYSDGLVARVRAVAPGGVDGRPRHSRQPARGPVGPGCLTREGGDHRQLLRSRARRPVHRRRSRCIGRARQGLGTCHGRTVRGARRPQLRPR